ncbi:ATP-dependent Clp protease adaptor protein ClpS [Mesorhizobium soli]|nr:ATP-dependent Clp protease adaptor protein ClpS [Mesorhizobium soli]
MAEAASAESATILSGEKKSLKSVIGYLHLSAGEDPAKGMERVTSVGGAIGMRMAHMQNGEDKGNAPGRGTAVITRTKPKTKKPSLYRVLILNDDYTPMEFVIHILERFFQKDRETATRIMLHVHNHGVGECGVYTFEVAETKVSQVMDFARQNQHPLQCVMEKK